MKVKVVYMKCASKLFYNFLENIENIKIKQKSSLGEFNKGRFRLSKPSWAGNAV